MKKLILGILLIIPFLNSAQWIQQGIDIEGLINENTGDALSLNSDGSIVAIAFNIDSPSKGIIRIYTNTSGNWVQIGSDIERLFKKNNSLSLSSNGLTVAIGSDQYDNWKGAVGIYTYLNGNWIQVGSDIYGNVTNDQLGDSVSLNSDGSVVAIGGSGFDNFKGTTRIYENTNGNWVQVGQDINGVDSSEGFGFSVSIGNTGSTVAIGAHGHDNKGTTRIYTNIDGNWVQVGSDIDGLVNDKSGYSVSLSSDETTVAIGSPDHDNYKGTTRIYTNISGNWVQVGSDIDGLVNDRSGYSVSLSSDGSVVAIGAEEHDLSIGTTRIYNNINDNWVQLGLDIDGDVVSDLFGYYLNLSSDGTTVAITARGHDNFKGTNRIYKNLTLSIQKNTFGVQFSVYPNPSFGSSKIHLGANYKEVTVQVYTILGKLVSTQKHSNTNEISLDTQKFTNGIYIVKVESGTKKASLKLVVK